MSAVSGRHCRHCGNIFVVASGSKRRFCSDRCQALADGRSWNDLANTARVDGGDYWKLHLPDHPNANKQGHVYEHVWVASMKLERAILVTEDVHHKNENKRDNRPENLEVLTKSGHQREHAGWSMVGGQWKKPCGRCKELFPATLDHFSSRNAEGTLLSSYCKKCQTEHKREYRAQVLAKENDNENDCDDDTSGSAARSDTAYGDPGG